MQDQHPRKHSLTLQGHRTSVSLEPAFWTAFRCMAAARGVSLNALAVEIDARRGARTGLATAIRLAVLDWALAGPGAGAGGRQAASHGAGARVSPTPRDESGEERMRSEDLDCGRLEHWSPREVWEALERDEIVLIDVRTPQEYMFEHVEGALLAPMADLRPERLPGQERKRIVFHCGSGARSRRVAEACARAGMDPVAHMEGGFAAWKAAGLPYVATDPATGAPRRVSP
ncbi:MAG: hypothetical protein KatS3mg118_1084 [Paracoccaceae bacterium]|nr:MAG: hypothetical protein KatS3mg118_1084 [Paracoccaceae bacterium]